MFLGCFHLSVLLAGFLCLCATYIYTICVNCVCRSLSVCVWRRLVCWHKGAQKFKPNANTTQDISTTTSNVMAQCVLCLPSKYKLVELNIWFGMIVYIILYIYMLSATLCVNVDYYVYDARQTVIWRLKIFFQDKKIGFPILRAILALENGNQSAPIYGIVIGLNEGSCGIDMCAKQMQWRLFYTAITFHQPRWKVLSASKLVTCVTSDWFCV